MPVVSAEPQIRAAVKQRVQAAWPDVKSIADESPKIPASSTDMPRAFLLLANETMTPGIGQVEEKLPYELTLQCLWPGSGTIQAAKSDRVQSFLSELTREARVEGATWSESPIEVSYLEGETAEKGEPMFEVKISFTLMAYTSLR